MSETYQAGQPINHRFIFLDIDLPSHKPLHRVMFFEDKVSCRGCEHFSSFVSFRPSPRRRFVPSIRPDSRANYIDLTLHSISLKQPSKMDFGIVCGLYKESGYWRLRVSTMPNEIIPVCRGEGKGWNPNCNDVL